MAFIDDETSNIDELSEESNENDVEKLQVKNELAANLARLIDAGFTLEDVKNLMGNKNIISSSTFTSRTQIPVPKILKGMSFEDYKDLVDKWECMTDVPKKKRAMILTMELPLNDAHGGLQRAVRNKYKNEELMVEEGVKMLMDFLGTILQEQTFVRLRSWMHRWENFRQKPSWSIERYLTEFHTLVSEAKSQFQHDIHPQFQALKLMNGCTEIPEDHVGSLTCSLDIKAQNFASEVEKIIRSFVTSRKALGTKIDENDTNYCDGGRYDMYGERIDTPDKSDTLFTSGASKRNKKFLEKKKAEALAKGNCIHCYQPGHRYKDCEEKKRKLERTKQWKLSKGIPWKNEDGTYTLPDGKIVPAGEAEANIKNKTSNTTSVGITFAMASPGSAYEPELLFEDNSMNTSFSNYIVEELYAHQEEHDPVVDINSCIYMAQEVKDNVVDIPEDVWLTNSGINNRAIVDTGCAKSVAGKLWVQRFISSIEKQDRCYIKNYPGKAKFRFGSGRTFSSVCLWRVPVYVGGKIRIMMFDEIDSDIPLLMSLPCMKKLSMMIDCKTDTAVVDDGVRTKLHRFDNGGQHYWISLSKEDALKDLEAVKQTNESILVAQQVFDDTNMKTQLEKLHIQMAHSTVEKITKEIKKADLWKPEMVDILQEIQSKCKSKKCRSRGQTQFVRKTAFRQFEKFGDLVSMDLKIRPGRKDILYILDHATHYVKADFIDSKMPEEIANKIIEMWFSAGLPRIKKMISDNGNEFTGEHTMSAACQKLNIKHETTAAYTPQQNGACERIHAVIDKNLEMIMEADQNIQEKTALCWATYAYNASESKTGYTPFQLVYGMVDHFPGILEANPTELQEPDLPQSIQAQFTARDEALANHMRIRSSMRIRNALLAKTRPTPDNKEVGAWVHFKRPLDKDWKGPGVVMASLGSNAVVKIGKQTYQCRHADMILALEDEIPEQVMPEHDEDSQKKTILPDSYQEERTERIVETISTYCRDPVTESEGVAAGRCHEVVDSGTKEQQSSLMEPSTQEGSSLTETPVQQESSLTESQQVGRLMKSPLRKESRPMESTLRKEGSFMDLPIQQQDVQINDSEGCQQNTVQRSVASTKVTSNSIKNISAPHGEKRKYDEEHTNTSVKRTRLESMHRGDKIQVLTTEGNWLEAEIISRYNKNKQKDAANFRVRVNGVEPQMVMDLKKVIWRSEEEFEDAHSNENAHANDEENFIAYGDEHRVFATVIPRSQHFLPECVKAKEKEHFTLKDFGSYQEIREDELNEEQKRNIIRSMWVIVKKQVMGQEVTKARLVARGDMEKVEIKVDSPTAAKQSMRCFLSIAATKGWKIQSLDFTGAFLQGSELDREVIVIPPTDLMKKSDNKRIFWKLLKPLYGLNDAARRWWKKLDYEMINRGCKRVIYDKAVYTYFKNGELQGLVCCHVDDVMYGGTSDFHSQVMDGVIASFNVGRVEMENFVFTGWNIQQTATEIKLAQNSYIDKIELEDLACLTEGSENSAILDEEKQSKFRRAVGLVGWITQVSRPEHSFTVTAMATRYGKATLGDAKKVMRVLNKLNENEGFLTYRSLGDLEKVRIKLYCDGSYGKLNGHQSVIGTVSFLEGSENASVIDWSSKKLAVPVKSALAAEAEAASDAYGKAMFLKALYEDMTGVKDVQITIVTDSNSLRQNVESDNLCKDKRTAISVSVLREAKEQGHISLKWTEGKDQLADIFTKDSVNPIPLRKVLQEGRILKEDT